MCTSPRPAHGSYGAGSSLGRKQWPIVALETANRSAAQRWNAVFFVFSHARSAPVSAFQEARHG
jgi:hypothetical protein